MNDDEPVDLRALAPLRPEVFDARVEAAAREAALRYARRARVSAQLVRLAPVSLALAAAATLLTWVTAARLAPDLHADARPSIARAVFAHRSGPRAVDTVELLYSAEGPR
jgi:hypothetical protein